MSRPNHHSLFSMISCAALLSTATACKSTIKTVELTAPAGTRVEYQVLPAGPQGEIVIQGTSEKGKQTLTMDSEAEGLSLVVQNPEKQTQGSPDLKLLISPATITTSKFFNPGKVETSLRLRARAHEPNGFEEAECENLATVTGSEGLLQIEVSAPKSPGDCSDAKLRKADPLWVGQDRDVGKSLNYFGEDQDRALGEQFVAEFNGKNGSSLVRDGTALPYLQNLMNQIARNSDAPHVQPKVHLINANVLNAFALPGGNVYVFRGLMESIQDENELIGVLGHEWGHVAARHGTSRMTSAINTQLVVTLAATAAVAASSKATSEKEKAIYDIITAATTTIVNVGGQLMLLAGSRADEEEADLLGSQYAYRLGYAPDGVGKFFASMMQNTAPRTWLEDLVATHPDHGLRVTNNKNYIEGYYPLGAMNLPATTPRFHEVRGALRALPPMIEGEAAKNLLSLQFIGTNQNIAKQMVSDFLKKKAGQGIVSSR